MHVFTFFPLGNADTIRLDCAGGEKMLFDYASVKDLVNKADKRCDLPAELWRDLDSAKRDHYDVVTFTHLDDDHIHGASEFFYLEHAGIYQSGKRAKIRELWVPAAVILEEGCDDEARIIRAEARYRLKKGQGIRVFSRPAKLNNWLQASGVSPETRKHLITDAGQIVPRFNIAEHGIEFFVHSPFASRLDNGELLDRNTDSLVLQGTFVVDGKTSKVILGSDIDHVAWTDIVKITKSKRNEHRLEWDIQKLSHHCSYLSIGPEKGQEKTQPVPETKWLFEEKGLGGHVKSGQWRSPQNRPKETGLRTSIVIT